MWEVLTDLWCSHLEGMALVVKEDKIFNPGDARLFSTDAIVTGAYLLAHLIG
jgi:hypothetical protein